MAKRSADQVGDGVRLGEKSDKEQLIGTTRESAKAAIIATGVPTENPETRNIVELRSLKEVCMHFDLGNLIDSKPIGNGRNNAITCLTTDKGKYVIKHYKDGNLNKADRVGKLALEAQFLDYLKNSGFKCGAVCSPEVFMYEGDYALIFDFVKGVPPEKNDENLLKLAKQTAIFHKLAEKFLHAKPLRNDERPDKEVIRESLKSIGLEPEKIDWLMRRLEGINLTRYPQNETDKPLQEFLIHGDLNPENMLSNGEDLYFIDFEFLKVSSPLYEITKIIEAWCTDDQKRIVTSKVNLFLSEYEKYKPLQKEELELLSNYNEWKLLARLVRNSIASQKETNLTVKEKKKKFAQRTVAKIGLFQDQKAEFEKALKSNRSK